MSQETNQFGRGLGWLLRAHYDGLAREPLPERWMELIRTLDEKQRLKLKAELSMEAEGKEDAVAPPRARALERNLASGAAVRMANGGRRWRRRVATAGDQDDAKAKA
jgi:hypothetical protein